MPADRCNLRWGSPLKPIQAFRYMVLSAHMTADGMASTLQSEGFDCSILGQQFLLRDVYDQSKESKNWLDLCFIGASRTSTCNNAPNEVAAIAVILAWRPMVLSSAACATKSQK